MAKRITEEEKKRINELYIIYHNYSEVARQVGCAPSTVKKYVIKDYKSEPEKVDDIIFLEEDIPEQIDLNPFIKSNNFGEFCTLTEEEENPLSLFKETFLY